MNNETLKNKQLCSDLTGVVSAAVDIAYVSTGPECSLGPAPTKLTAGQFQDLRDTKHLITSKPGMFWCYTHLQDLPVEKQSPDPRYCQQCYENLVKDADDMKAVGNYHKPWWIPCTRQPSGQDHVQVQGQVTQTPTVSVTPQNCLFCGKELTKRRKSKLFCGAVCRVRYSRQQKEVRA